jgi:hypothetical protein
MFRNYIWWYNFYMSDFNFVIVNSFGSSNISSGGGTAI